MMKGNGIFTIDGLNLRLWVTSLKRKFAVTDSENSGRVQSAEMYRDVIGTFYNYTVTVEPDKSNRADYDTFYEMISAPTPSHSLIFPYGQDTLEFKAYVTSGEDSLKKTRDAHGNELNIWSGLSVDFVAMAPQRR